MEDHQYDDPSLTPVDFLVAVYRDRSLPIEERIRAAGAAQPYFPIQPIFKEREPWPGERMITIHIGGISQGNEAHESQDHRHRPTVQPTVHVTYEPEPEDHGHGQVGHA